jgi:outer membrane protein OmpA-like peptidoglycan-associated protein
MLLAAPVHAQQSEAQPVGLGSNVNSRYEELAPVITPDGKTLYFVREGDPKNRGYRNRDDDQDIWYARIGKDGSWGKAENIGAPLNTEFNNGLSGISSDGTIALVFGYYRGGKRIQPGYSLAHLTKQGWSTPVGIDIADFAEIAVGRYLAACLSEDGRTIVFSVSQNEDNSDDDLFVTFHVAGSEWSRPRPLTGLNGMTDDSCPFLASDGQTLYFSSIRDDGYGGHDVYMTRRLDDSWKHWSDPVNLGPSVNTSGGDLYYTIPASGQYAYYTSTAESDNSDIYRIELPDSVRPKPVVIITGRIFNSRTKKPIETRVEYESLADGKKVGSATSNPQTGEYQIILPSGRLYGFYATAEGMYPVSQNLDLTNLASYKEIRRDLFLAPIEQGAAITLNNIFFDFDRYQLRDESKPELDRLIAVLEQSPTMTVRLNGHTDNVGTPEYNRTLSENRANAVRQYLIGRGIASSRLTVRGFGFTKPVSSNDDEEGRQHNRRVEFVILTK